MSGDPTEDLDIKKPFEERVFARFDALEEYLRSLDARVQTLESRSYDTKPIWERALQEIVETRQELREIRDELKEMRSEVKETRDELKETRSEVRETRDELKETRSEVKETRDEMKYFKRVLTDRLDQLHLVALETVVDVRRAHDRIDKIESRPS
jgi:chromosome segregation ATPase